MHTFFKKKKKFAVLLKSWFSRRILPSVISQSMFPDNPLPHFKNGFWVWSELCTKGTLQLQNLETRPYKERLGGLGTVVQLEKRDMAEGGIWLLFKWLSLGSQGVVPVGSSGLSSQHTYIHNL